MDLRDPQERAHAEFLSDKRARAINLLASVLPGDSEGFAATADRIRTRFGVDDCERLVAAIAHLKKVRSATDPDQVDVLEAQRQVAYASIGEPVTFAISNR